MGLNTALVDQARVLNKRAAGRVVDGETIYAQVEGEWFKARLELGRETESIDPATGERTVQKTPNLMFAFRDAAGAEVEVTIEDKLEVKSVQLGDAIWQVIADPQPIRKKRKVIGYETTLRRVVVHGNPG